MEPVELFHIRDLDRGLLEGERDRLLQFLRCMLPFASVIEVGSTAVEGLLGKQDIDFLARVSPTRFYEARGILDRNFHRNERQLSNDEFQGYLVPSPVDVAIQLTIENEQYDVFEVFLELLRADGELRRAYNTLKIGWNGRRMEEYRAAKQAFIAAALANKAKAE